MSNVDTFRLKKGTLVGSTLGGVFFLVIGVGFCCFMAYLAIEQEDTTAAIVGAVIGLLAIGMGALGIYGGTTGAKNFIALSDDGINFGNKTIILWDDIENAHEEDVNIQARGVTIKKKQVVIRYADRKEGKVKQAQIISDYEGYDFMREKILRRLSETRKSQ